MMTEADVREKLRGVTWCASRFAGQGNFHLWFDACNQMRLVDEILGDDQAPGYAEPTDRVPFPVAA